MKYLEHFKLNEEPFTNTPDPRYLHNTVQHREALAICQLVIQNRRGMAVVYGEIGMGKSTISRRLLDILKGKEEYVVAMLLTPALRTENAFLKAIMDQLGVKTKRSYNDSLEEFQKYLITKHKEGKIVVVLIDEAQKLTPKMMDVLHTLDNFESNKVKYLQRVLIGQRELLDVIDNKPEIRSRIAGWAELKNLNYDDTKELIAFRWATASGRKSADPFNDESIDAIQDYSNGIPRDIVNLCYDSLLRAALLGYDEVTVELVDDAADARRLTRHKTNMKVAG
jgi:general secretion pathway protein A